MSRCPLCHRNIASSEQSWRSHLLSQGNDGCPQNTRRRQLQHSSGKKGEHIVSWHTGLLSSWPRTRLCKSESFLHESAVCVRSDVFICIVRWQYQCWWLHALRIVWRKNTRWELYCIWHCRMLHVSVCIWCFCLNK